MNEQPKRIRGWAMVPWRFLALVVVAVLLVSVGVAEARSGCCSWHGGVCGCGCCDGTPLSATCAPYYPGCGGGYNFNPPIPTTPSCPLMSSYNSLSGDCECYSGYIVSAGQCVSGNSYCYGKYGYNSSYSSLTKSCECDYGYILDPNSQCISRDKSCQNLSSYNILANKCQCRSGYVISGGSCTDGDSVCRSEHGLYSSYNSLENSCACDSGYTFDNTNQCVKKQNNVYFTLKELDTDTRMAIIQSNHDYGYYLVTYGIGCYSFSFERYLDDKIVVNLGTDFDLDVWDKIVLQNDSEGCDIIHVERVDSSTTLKPDEAITDWETPPVVPVTPNAPPTFKGLSINNANPSLNEILKTTEPAKPNENTSTIVSSILKEDTSSTISSTLEEPSASKVGAEKTPQPGFFTRVFGSIASFFSKIFR